MPLFRQLWLAVILITLTSFAGSFAVSILGTRSYLEQRLQRKNVDAASMLARSISQLSKDPSTIGAQTGALMETGQFQSITITAPDGKIIGEQVSQQKETSVPAWFADFFPIRAEAGQAQISDNRMHFGVIKVVGDDRLAEQALWDETLALIVWYLIAGMVSGLIGMFIMRLIKQPLAIMTEQAEAITERRFLTITEPGISELRSIARATNDLVRRLHNRTIEETLHLETLGKRINHDPLTGLPNRDYFLRRFQALLERDQRAQNAGQTQTTDERAIKTGFLLLLHAGNLVEINRKLGRIATNALLREIAAIMEAASSDPERITARLNGTDFVLVLPGVSNLSNLLAVLATRLNAALSRINGEVRGSWHIGAIQYKQGDKRGDILASADTALALAEGKGTNTWHIVEKIPSSMPVPAVGISDWRNIFSSAVAENRFRLTLFPVTSAEGKALHDEGVARMQALPNGGWLAAADFIPIATRLGTVASLDLATARGALDHLRSSEGELAINLSIETIHDWRSRNELAELLRQQPDSSRTRLWIEVREYDAFRQLDSFRHFCETFRQMGCRVGIEHFGRHSSELQTLAGFGLDYLKVDSAFVRGINQNKENQKLLKGMCRLAHASGILIIALGVETDAERRVLFRLGFDGVTGPCIK